MSTSCLVASAPTAPHAAAYPLENVSAASVPLNRASFSSSRRVRGPRPADQPRRPAADAVLVDGSLRRLAQDGIVRQPEVVVGRKIDQGAALGQLHRAVGRGLHLAQPPVQRTGAQGVQFTLEGVIHADQMQKSECECRSQRSEKALNLSSEF